jgi:hypothetical protein
MHEPVAAAAHRGGQVSATDTGTQQGNSIRAGTVIPLSRARRRHIAPRPPRRAPTVRYGNRLPEWILHLLDNRSQCQGSVRATLDPGTSWTDLDGVHRRNPDVNLAALPVALDAALDHAFTTLSMLGAQPRLDVELSITHQDLTVALRGLIADPVMRPAVADAITASLYCDPNSTWQLHTTDRGELHWTREPQLDG